MITSLEVTSGWRSLLKLQRCQNFGYIACTDSFAGGIGHLWSARRIAAGNGSYSDNGASEFNTRCFVCVWRVVYLTKFSKLGVKIWRGIRWRYHKSDVQKPLERNIETAQARPRFDRNYWSSFGWIRVSIPCRYPPPPLPDTSTGPIEKRYIHCARLVT